MMATLGDVAHVLSIPHFRKILKQNVQRKTGRIYMHLMHVHVQTIFKHM